MIPLEAKVAVALVRASYVLSAAVAVTVISFAVIVVSSVAVAFEIV